MLILIGQSVNLKSKFWPISENKKITNKQACSYTFYIKINFSETIALEVIKYYIIKKVIKI